MKNIKHIIYIAAVTLFTVNVSAQVKVGDNPTTIADGSILEVESTTGAFVPPRMTTAQMNAIASPLAGSQIYNTDEDCIYMYNGTYWRGLCNRMIQTSAGGPLQVTGTNSVDLTETFTVAGRTNYKVIASFVPHPWTNGVDVNAWGTADILIDGVSTGNTIRFSSNNNGNDIYRYSSVVIWMGTLDPGSHTITFRVTRTGGSVGLNAEDRRMIIELY